MGPNLTYFDKLISDYCFQKVCYKIYTYSTGYKGYTIQKSVLSNQMQQWQEEMNIRLSGKKVPPKYWEYPEFEKGNIHKHCAYCIDLNCPKTLDLESLFTNENENDNEEEDGTDEYVSCGMSMCPWGCGAKYHSCKLTEHLLICLAYEEPGEFDWIARGVSSDQFRNSQIKKDQAFGRKKNNKEQKAVELKSKSIGDLYLGPGRPANETLKEKLRKILPNPPKTLLKDQSVTQNELSLDISVERQAKHQVKPIRIYSFLCGKNFRRDEYHSHMKNVHDDIMGGIDSWIEHRCPLASYGCEFSSRSWYPESYSDINISWKRNVIFSPGIESFGAKMVQHKNFKYGEDPRENKVNMGSNNSAFNSTVSNLSTKGLLDLPDEILYKVIEFLDPFW